MELALNIGPLKPETWDLLIAFVAFGLLFAVLAGVILPRIAKVLKEREEAIEGGQDRAEELRDQAERAHEEYQQMLAEARHEAARMRQESAEQGAALLAELRAEGQRQREEMLASARVQIDADRALAEAALQQEIDSMATRLAGKIVGEPLEEFARGRK
ncbi:F0F1 ATP synthase subunit B [Streptomyces palmae]|uniref:ATP synthase subunit b n=1 Tax=Streptomyces palmae TaxID=1701085 RepID=A0A4Z0FPC1_9ACTN|nr:F0F1 ATP synthase subunit B [Streptomyces palmae]TGA84532.1 F0F1 ATP synthase subunit B [Streptomyces palmae]